MIWPVLTIVAAAALLAVYLWHRSRLRLVRAEWRAENSRRETREHAQTAETLARQDALFDSMIEAVLILDEVGRVQFANRAFAQMFATTGILRGRALIEAVRLHEIAEIVERAHVEGRVIDHEVGLPGEPERWLQINAATMTGVDRRPLGTILVLHDLTRIKRLERTREEFVANVSHELRTPLSLIKGYTETLLDGAKDNPEVATRFLQTIQRNAERLQFLIEDLLTISELESGRVRMDPGGLSLGLVVDRVFADYRDRASRKGVRLVSTIGDITARADERRIQQVFSNLVDNAIKYGRLSGTVTVNAVRRPTDLVEVSVGDDGPGIPPEALDRVFERFYRVDKARSRDQGGTGLGLSIVKHIVQSHGGEVWATSQAGQGATFFFTLPNKPPEPAAAPPQAEPEPPN